MKKKLLKLAVGSFLMNCFFMTGGFAEPNYYKATNGGSLNLGDAINLVDSKRDYVLQATKGGSITVGSGTTIKMHTTERSDYFSIGPGKYYMPNAAVYATREAKADAAAGTIIIGDGAVIENHLDLGAGDRAGGFRAVNSDFGSTVIIGDDCLISVKITGGSADSNDAVTAEGKLHESGGPETGAKVMIGKNATIITDSLYSNAVAARMDGVVNIGAGSSIITKQQGSHGIFSEYYDAGSGFGSGSGTVNLGAGSSITTVGASSYGILAKGGFVNTADLTITTSGSNAHGVKAQEGGAVELNGATISVATEKSSAAIVASGVSVETGAISKVTGSGVYHITGDIKAENGGSIDIDLAVGSTFTGRAAVDTGTASANKLALGANSLWLVTGDSELTSLKNAGGTIDLSNNGSSFSTLKVENLSGNGGTFILAIDGSQPHQSDKLIVTDTFEGTQQIDLKEINGRESDPTLGKDAAGTVLVSVKNNNGIFTAVDGEGTLYHKRYELDHTGNTSRAGFTDWYLKGVEYVDPGTKPTTAVETIIASGALGYHTWRDNDQLMKRLGDLRQQGAEVEGAWVRTSGRKIKRNGSFGFENKVHHYELGYDQKVRSTEKYTVYGGVAVSYSDGSGSYSSGSGDNKDKALSIYLTQIGAKGHYLDIVAKVNRMDTDFKVTDSNNKRISGDFNNTGIALSTEYGRQNKLRGDWYIEPQVQLTLGRLGSVSYTTDNGISVRQSGIKSAVSRLGFNLGRNVDSRTNVYLKVNWLHEFGGSHDVAMTDSNGERAKIDRGYGDTWLEYGIGAALQTGKNNYLYFDLERSNGSDFKKDWNWNIGARWSF